METQATLDLLDIHCRVEGHLSVWHWKLLQLQGQQTGQIPFVILLFLYNPNVIWKQRTRRLSFISDRAVEGYGTYIEFEQAVIFTGSLDCML